MHGGLGINIESRKQGRTGNHRWEPAEAFEKMSIQFILYER
jgi:hypothetical protein